LADGGGHRLGDVAHTALVRRLYAGIARTDPGPARPLHNGLAGIVRQRAGDRPVAERMRRSTGLARSASAQAPPDACPLAIGSCGWCVALLTRRRGGRE